MVTEILCTLSGSRHLVPTSVLNYSSGTVHPARQACQTLNFSTSQSASVCSNSTALKGVTSYSPVQHQKHKVLALFSNVSSSYSKSVVVFFTNQDLMIKKCMM